MLTFLNPQGQASKRSLALAILCLSINVSLIAQEVIVSVKKGTNMAGALSPDGKTIAIDLQGTIYTLPGSGGTATALTDGMGDERQPAWSPDGNKIVFQSYRDGNFHLWEINKDGSALRQITFGKYDDREPFWSPDGTRIVFASDRGGNYDIWSLSLTTGDIIQITTDPANDFNPAISPDGKRIAFISARQKGGLMIIDASGGERVVVPAQGTFNGPSWSPDGKQISFTS